MRRVDPCATLGLLAMLLVAACASSRPNGWVDLKTDAGTVPALQFAGTVHRLDVEGGVWVIRDPQGATYQPTNLPETFRKEGMSVEAEGRRRDDLASIGMAGTLVDLTRWADGPSARRTSSSSSTPCTSCPGSS